MAHEAIGNHEHADRHAEHFYSVSDKPRHKPIVALSEVPVLLLLCQPLVAAEIPTGDGLRKAAPAKRPENTAAK